jgi:hypothetical protein
MGSGQGGGEGELPGFWNSPGVTAKRRLREDERADWRGSFLVSEPARISKPRHLHKRWFPPARSLNDST